MLLLRLSVISFPLYNPQPGTAPINWGRSVDTYLTLVRRLISEKIRRIKSLRRNAERKRRKRERGTRNLRRACQGNDPPKLPLRLLSRKLSVERYLSRETQSATSPPSPAGDG